MCIKAERFQSELWIFFSFVSIEASNSDDCNVGCVIDTRRLKEMNFSEYGSNEPKDKEIIRTKAFCEQSFPKFVFKISFNFGEYFENNQKCFTNNLNLKGRSDENALILYEPHEDFKKYRKSCATEPEPDSTTFPDQEFIEANFIPTSTFREELIKIIQ